MIWQALLALIRSFGRPAIPVLIEIVELPITDAPRVTRNRHGQYVAIPKWR